MTAARTSAPTWALGVLLDLARKQRVHGVLSSLVILPVLNAFILAGLYQTLDGAPFDLAAFAGLYPYFIATTAFVAAAASWEVDLLTGTLQAYLGRPFRALQSRTAFISLCVLPFLMLFVSIRAVTAPDSVASDIVAMLVITIGTATIGVGVALMWGFRTDKSINNLAQVAPWVLALGPSPFFPDGVSVITWALPGGGSEDVWVEALRGACYVGVGIWLTVRALGARRTPIYAP